MDFVVSKVAMSICALLVVSVLSGVLGDNALFKNSDELSSVLNDLSTTLEASAWASAEMDIVWDVPFLSDGQDIEISVGDHAITARAGQKSALTRPACELHTWIWNGSALNRSSLELLDAKAPSVKVRSGLALDIDAREIPFENQNKVFVFVRTAA